MNIKRILSVLLCIIMMPAVPFVNAEETGIVIAGEQIYRESFEEDTNFAQNTEYKITKDGDVGVLSFDRTGKIDNMQSLAGPEIQNVISEFDMKLTGASGATNNSVFFTLRATDVGGEGIKFGYHDITKYDNSTGNFGNSRYRDRISLSYSSGSDDMTKWEILSMSDTLGVENTSSKTFEDYYTFKTALIGDKAYYQVISPDSEVKGNISADISGYTLPEKGRMYIGAHNCAAYIDEIRMYNAVEVKNLSIEADNMELSAGKTTNFNIRVCDEEGIWHTLDKSRNVEFGFEYDEDKLMVDAEKGTITALSDTDLKLYITAKDFYTEDIFTDEFVFESISDEDAVSMAKDALNIEFSEVDGDFTLPQSGLYSTAIEWTSSSNIIRINNGSATVILPQKDTDVTLKARITRNEAAIEKEFNIIVKAQPKPVRDVILKGDIIYSECFEDERVMDADLKAMIDNERIKYEEGSLYVDSKSVVMQPMIFGPETSDCIVEYDVKQLSCNANSNAQLSMGLRTSGNVSYRFAYADVSAYNTQTNTLNGPTSRDRIFIGETNSSGNMSNWTLFGTGKSPIGILNTSTRSFEKFYTFSAATASNTLLFSVLDENDTVLDSVGYYDDELDFGKGRLSLNMQSTEFLLDNIYVYDAVGFNSLSFKPEKSVLKPGENCGFEIYINDDALLDKKYYKYLEYTLDEGAEIDAENATIKVSGDGEYAVKVEASDFNDKSVKASVTALVSASSRADELEKIIESINITNYIDYPNGIVNDFELPINISSAKTVWSSDNPAIIIDGTKAKVNRQENNINVKLTVLVTLEGISAEKTFNVTVEKKYTDEESIELDRNLIEIPERTSEDISLPINGRYGSSIKWSSDNSSVISGTGKVKRSNADERVTLTALFSIGNIQKKYYYTVIVEGKGSGAGTGQSGGSGGISVGSVGTVKDSADTPKISVSVGSDANVEEFEFEDVGRDFWGYDAIYELAEVGVIAKDKVYRPNDNITREEFVKLAVEAFGLYNTSAQCNFVDVAEDAWYYKYVASAVESNIISGISETSFGAGKLITREDMAVIIARVLDSKGYGIAESECYFADALQISKYALNAVSGLCKMGILSGMGENNFAPKSNATRAEAAVILSRAYK